MDVFLFTIYKKKLKKKTLKKKEKLKHTWFCYIFGHPPKLILFQFHKMTAILSHFAAAR